MTAGECLTQAEQCLHVRDLPCALAGFDKAEAAGADADRCSAGRWLAHMLHGAFEEAWRESDAIRRRGAPDPHRFWNGGTLRGRRVMLRCLHGLGDAVQFLRYAPSLRAMCAALIVQAPPALLELAPMFAGVTTVIPWDETMGAAVPQWDVQVEINELPYLFRTTERHLPLATRYLQLPEAWKRAMRPEPRDPNNLRVGVVWASGAWNPGRSVPLDLFRSLLQVPGCEFWNLQGGEARGEWHRFGHAPELHAAEKCAHRVSMLAALIEQLDLVITCDTLAAHLAGALGTEAWVLLEHAADWRWQLNRTDSPWYPSLRLFRQAQAGGWRGVVHAATAALQMRAAARGQQLTV